MKRKFEDADFDSSLKDLDSHFIWKKKQMLELKNRILTDIETLEINRSNKNLIKLKNNNKKSVTDRLVYSGFALVLLFSLFIGSAFVSPAMAEVVSKIPYLSKLFESEPINRVIWMELEEKGYMIVGVSGNPNHILISIDGSEQYFQNVRGEVKEIAAKILKSNDYDTYTIKVNRQIDKVPSVSERDKYMGESLNEIHEELIKLQFNVISQAYSYSSPDSPNVIIEIDVPNTENRIEEIKEIYSKKLEAKNIDSYSIKINKIDTVQKEKELEWENIVHVIYSGLTAKEEYKVTGVSYQSSPRQIIINTAIDGSEKDAPKKVIHIEQTIKEFLNSKEIKEKINGEPYKIIIKSKDNQKIN
ncbi:MAG: DUF4030 domain-containing protein [Bacillus sp. (in: firmicutes)]